MQLKSICKICKKICKKYAKYASNMQVWWYCLYCMQYAKYAKTYARYAKYANVIFNMQNMPCPVCWWRRRDGPSQLESHTGRLPLSQSCLSAAAVTSDKSPLLPAWRAGERLRSWWVTVAHEFEAWEAQRRAGVSESVMVSGSSSLQPDSASPVTAGSSIKWRVHILHIVDFSFADTVMQILLLFFA